MRLRAFTALFAGTLAYMSVIVIGVILGMDLSSIFTWSLGALAFFAAGGWLITYTLETLSRKHEFQINNDYNSSKTRGSQQETGEDSETKQSENNNSDTGDNSEFTPLDPPILEVDNREE
ncbi:hypothetical protein [Halothermothrix orenii]|uniref:Uncharacterized protein n=1 Tax=Halothermothrix orenii (strain H 168 / OCM 544 / DSM 9562) TaxID=373903 RepID=B8CYP5_HALOH|nr:hypothetical protein [Halothermothrix orenii]ACL70414.1 hypothetical protein Hore_16640 [Halothermothrix orenii H 168]